MTKRSPAILWILTVTFLILPLFFQSDQASAEDIDDLIRKMSKNFEILKDYRCIFSKNELVSDELIEQKNILYKFKKPLCVYMKWTEAQGCSNRIALACVAS